MSPQKSNDVGEVGDMACGQDFGTEGERIWGQGSGCRVKLAHPHRRRSYLHSRVKRRRNIIPIAITGEAEPRVWVGFNCQMPVGVMDGGKRNIQKGRDPVLNIGE